MKGFFQNKVFQGTLWYSLAGVLTGSMNFILLPVLTNAMSPTEYGLLNTALALSAVALPCMLMGMGPAIVRYYHEYREDRERFYSFFSTAFWFQIIIICCFCGAALTLLEFGAISSIAGVEAKYLLPVVFNLLLVSPRDLGNQLLTTSENHRGASLNQIVAFLVATSTSLLFILIYDLGALGRLYGLVCGAVVAVYMLRSIEDLRSYLFARVSLVELKQALKFGLPCVPYAFSMAAMLSVDRLVLKQYLDFETVGVYSAAKSFAMGLACIFIAMTRAWYPRYFQYRDQKKEKEILIGQLTLTCLLSWSVLGFLILSPVVFPLLVNDDFVGDDSIFLPLSLAMYCYGFFMLQASYFNYLKKTWCLPIIAGSGAMVNLWAANKLVPVLYSQGSAVSLLVGYFIMCVLMLVISYFLEKRLLERLLIPSVSIVILLLGLYAVDYMDADTLLWERLIHCVGVTLSIFVIWLYMKSRLSKTGRLLR